jgi:hypothetical protein
MGPTSELITPLVDAIRNYVIIRTKLHACDTPVPVLAPGNGQPRRQALDLRARRSIDHPLGNSVGDPSVRNSRSFDMHHFFVVA